MSGEGDAGGPPKLERVKPAAPGASPGLAAPELTAAAAVAASLPHAGALSTDSVMRLWYLAAASQAAGRLELETERGRFTLCFKRGVIEHAASDAPEDDLGNLLVTRGVVGAEAVADAQRVRADLGGDLVAALTSLRLMNPAESFRILQEHGAAVVARALGAAEGTFGWQPGAPLPPSSFPLGSRWGVLCDAARKLGGLTVRKLLGDRADRVASRAGGRVPLSELKLTAHEARAAALFDGSSSPAQLAAARPVDAETILRVALLLGDAELLSFGAAVASAPPARPAPLPPPTLTPPPTSTPAPVPAASRTPARAAAPPAAKPTQPAAAPKPAAPAAPRVEICQDPAKLRAFHERVAAGDHFEALGVKREATAAQIKAAYFQLARSYHPDAGPADEPADLKKLRADIFARLGEAWGVLGDDAKRAEYLRELASGGPANVDISAIFQAEELFRKATVLVRTRQYGKALETLQEAIQLNADEPEFGVWQAWVEFLVSSERNRQHAASAAVMEAALKKVPRCMPAYQFLAQMAKLQGDPDLAEKHLKRGLALEPDHVELARELKFLRK